MGLRQLLVACKAKLGGLFRARGVEAMIFSGTPVLKEIGVSHQYPGNCSLIYKNGLMLTLGEAGILDYQDRGFGHFIHLPNGRAVHNRRDFLVHLHKIVLKSLLRYIIHPGLDTLQRERAAEAASRLWMATEDGPGRGQAGTEDGFRNPDSARESAPLR